MKKSLGVKETFAIATGAMIGSGFFLLPGIAYGKAGPAVILSYFLAAVLIVPTLLSKAELATAMPRSGGTYFFVSRSIGSLAGAIDGIGAWVVMVAKSAFALVGIGYYLAIIFSRYLELIPGWDGERHEAMLAEGIGIAVVVVLAFVNARGSEHSGKLQAMLVFGLLLLSSLFVGVGAFHVDISRFGGFFEKGPGSIFATAALVFVSYAGLTKVDSVSEEIRDPERTIPLGMIMALGVTSLAYVLGVVVVVGTLGGDELSYNLTPLASAAGRLAGMAGVVVMGVAGVLAFVTTANAGVLSGSRYLQAMGRDKLVPVVFARLSKRGIPLWGIVVSTGVIIAVLVCFDAEGIAKLASTVLLVEFAAVHLSVIVMRESRVISYDPGFRSPGYPWVQIIGLVVSAVLIPLLGVKSMLFAGGLFAVAVVWYVLYAKGRSSQASAINHVLRRIAREILSRDVDERTVEDELREIIKEKGLRDGDPFAGLIGEAELVDLPEGGDWEAFMKHASEKFAAEYPQQASEIWSGLLESAREGRTPAANGVALPHVCLDGVRGYELVVARSKDGLSFPGVTDPVRAVFVLLGSRDDPQQHLRMLAAIASRAEDSRFMRDWLAARDVDGLRVTLLGGHGAEDA
jgi:amino acid transporter/mannitol/fructose-specific phosphotransferase system IIA component (Ntr-type)